MGAGASAAGVSATLAVMDEKTLKETLSKFSEEGRNQLRQALAEGAPAGAGAAPAGTGGCGLNPMTFAACMPLGHDLTLHSEHKMYTLLADALYKDLTMAQLLEIEKNTSEKIEDTWKHSTMFHIAVKDAISKKLMDEMPALHCTVVFAMYKEQNRILPKGADTPGVSHPNGEDFIRKKHQQMTWLFENRKDCSWTLMGADDGCPMGSTDLALGIAKDMGYDNVSVVKLKDAVKAGESKVLDFDKLKSEAWNEEDALVKASQKGGAIIYALHEAQKEGAKNPGKEHVIVYTDSDLSTDLRLCGLNFKTIFKDGYDCSVSQRFGQPCAVNCGKLVTSGGIAPGMPPPSMVHLTLRHKLRMNLLPPLSPITDTNCGHKAIKASALEGVLAKVQDYKGSFDMDWLMCVGICSKAAGRNPIGVTAIPWVNSVGESNFWSAGPSSDETPEEAKLRSCTSWHKIFKTMTEMHGWHKEGLEKAGLLTEESKAYVEWVSGMDVQMYMRLTDAINKQLEGKEVTMPEPSVLSMDLEALKKLAA